jgi:hypothetical protein
MFFQEIVTMKVDPTDNVPGRLHAGDRREPGLLRRHCGKPGRTERRAHVHGQQPERRGTHTGHAHDHGRARHADCRAGQPGHCGPRVRNDLLYTGAPHAQYQCPRPTCLHSHHPLIQCRSLAALGTSKADQTFVTTQLATKADTATVTAALASRAETTVVMGLSTSVMDLSAGMVGLRAALTASLAVQQATATNLSAALVAQRASQQLEASSLSTTIAALSTTLQSFSTAMANQLATLTPMATVTAVNARVTVLEQQLQAARDCNASGGTMALISPNSSSIYSCVYPGCQAVPATGVYWIRLPAFPADVFSAFCRVDSDGSKWYLFQVCVCAELDDGGHCAGCLSHARQIPRVCTSHAHVSPSFSSPAAPHGHGGLLPRLECLCRA